MPQTPQPGPDDEHDGRDDWNERAIPTIPHRRRPAITEDWNADAARRTPRQPGPTDTDH